MTKELEPIHPGEILEEEFMKPLGLSANAVAKAIDVPVTRVSEIIRGRRGVTADTALRLARYFGTTAELWQGLQAEHDLRVAQRDFGGEIAMRVRRLETAGTEYGRDHSDATKGSEVRESGASYRSPSPRRLRDRRRDRRKAASSPVDESRLRKNPGALASVRRGIAQAKGGKLTTRTFKKHCD